MKLRHQHQAATEVLMRYIDCYLSDDPDARPAKL